MFIDDIIYLYICRRHLTHDRQTWFRRLISPYNFDLLSCLEALVPALHCNCPLHYFPVISTPVIGDKTIIVPVLAIPIPKCHFYTKKFSDIMTFFKKYWVIVTLFKLICEENVKYYL